MVIALHVAFYIGSLLYCCAGALSLTYLWKGTRRVLDHSVRLVWGGTAGMLAMFAIRWATYGRIPLTTLSDSLSLFLILSSTLMVIITRKDNVSALLSFYLPPLAVVSLVNAAGAFRYLTVEPLQLRGAPLVVHVGLAFLAYALFFAAGMTSAAYLCHTSHLKHHRSTWLTKRMPSLQELDTTLSRLLMYAYPLFVLTLAQGLVWAWLDPTPLGPHWWLAPKVVLSFVMVVFYACAVHLRFANMLRGPKLSYMVLFGFLVLFGLFVGLTLANVRGYNFWSGKP
ncbi:MAG: cytochrome c biogenesis protein CcsA [Candidatus Hydrogenedentes bacterium]|nr:cytochrome c biogenesis protein CcsA [Candidatus Hydrogenedentota bacterium]